METDYFSIHHILSEEQVRKHIQLLYLQLKMYNLSYIESPSYISMRLPQYRVLRPRFRRIRCNRYFYLVLNIIDKERYSYRDSILVGESFGIEEDFVC